MKKMIRVILIFFLFLSSLPAYALTRGIYITQSSLERTDLIKYFIAKSKEVGIDTFVIDLEKPSKRYRENIALVKESGIHYVSRIVMFPDGATREQLSDRNIWEKKYRLVKQAIEWGAEQIQLDYIRYNTKQGASRDNAKQVAQVVNFFQTRLASQNIPLQADIFGITAYTEGFHIGQNVAMMAEQTQVICPMVYPSHFEPYLKHSANPFETVSDSLSRIKNKFPKDKKTDMISWIELSNYRVPMSESKRVWYIQEQIRGVVSAGASGWYAWSPNNKYDILFNVLKKAT